MARRPAVLLACACGCALATVALWLLANDTAAGRRLDAQLAAAVFTGLSGVNRELLKGATSFGDLVTVAVGALALVALAWLRGGRALALVAALVLLSANVATQVAQPLLHDARSVDLGGTAVQGSASWPSGHATATMLLALVAIFVAGPRLRAVTALAALAFAAGVGVALVGLGSHLPSDVLAGLLVAAAFTAAGAAAYAVLRRRPAAAGARTAARSPRIAPALGQLAAGAVLATALGKALVTRPAEFAHTLGDVPLALGAAGALTAVLIARAGAALLPGR